MKLIILVTCFWILNVVGYEKEPYRIFISNTKGNLTRAKLDIGKKKASILTIRSSTVYRVDEDAFCNIPDLTSLIINGCSSFPKVTNALLKCTPKLQSISIDYNEQLVIDRAAFANLSELKSLRLSNTILPRLGKDLFIGLDLNGLYLQDCQIEEIDADTFTNLPNLEWLNLGYNKLKEFKIGTFKHLLHLKHLLLNSNRIDVLKWEQWDKLPSLRRLDFADNNITTFDVSKVLDFFPQSIDLNIGGCFSPEKEHSIKEEAKKYNMNLKTWNYY